MITSSAVVSGHNAGETARRKEKHPSFFALSNPPVLLVKSATLLNFHEHVWEVYISSIKSKTAFPGPYGLQTKPYKYLMSHSHGSIFC